MTMDTKTSKQEALALLAMDTMTDEQAERLNYLTAKQAGYEVRSIGAAGRTFSGKDVEKFALFRQGERIKNTAHYTESDCWKAVPEFCTSVDACLSLPLPDGRFWVLETKTTGVERAGPYRATIYITFKTWDEQQRFTSDNSLSLTMMRAWWNMQPD